MKSESKLAHLRDTIHRFHLHNVIHSARRVIEGKTDRLATRPLQNIDGWSDQAEVAFYEEAQWRKA